MVCMILVSATSAYVNRNILENDQLNIACKRLAYISQFKNIHSFLCYEAGEIVLSFGKKGCCNLFQIKIYRVPTV